MERAQIADLILEPLVRRRDALRAEFNQPRRIRSCIIDDLLPTEVALDLHRRFPKPDDMTCNHTLREYKHVSAQMNKHDPLMEEAIFAFQDPRVVAVVEEITTIRPMEADTLLYAGGLSQMGREEFLNPHLDASHDLGQSRYRVLNLLYYVTPGWETSWGGNLELYDGGPGSPPRTIPSLFNRLVLMETNRHSWHGVSPVVYEAQRQCISNYYFSPVAPGGRDYAHITYFRGRPKSGMTDVVLNGDSFLRNVRLRVWYAREAVLNRVPALSRLVRRKRHTLMYHREESAE